MTPRATNAAPSVIRMSVPCGHSLRGRKMNRCKAVEKATATSIAAARLARSGTPRMVSSAATTPVTAKVSPWARLRIRDVR